MRAPPKGEAEGFAQVSQNGNIAVHPNHLYISTPYHLNFSSTLLTLAPPRLQLPENRLNARQGCLEHNPSQSG